MVKEKFLLSDMINSDIEIILKINVTKSGKKKTSYLPVVVCPIFICVLSITG